MNNTEKVIDFDIEIKKLLKNVEEMKADIDLYGMIVEEQILVSV